MTDDTPKFTHIGISRQTQRKIALLAKLNDIHIFELVASWADAAWKSAKMDGLVKDTMLVERERGAHYVSSPAE